MTEHTRALAQGSKRPDADQIMAVLRKVTAGSLYEMLTCSRWKDGIDITAPTYAAERLAEEFAALGCQSPAVCSDIEKAFADVCEQLGCKQDNEDALQAILDLQNALTGCNRDWNAAMLRAQQAEAQVERATKSLNDLLFFTDHATSAALAHIRSSVEWQEARKTWLALSSTVGDRE